MPLIGQVLNASSSVTAMWHSGKASPPGRGSGGFNPREKPKKESAWPLCVNVSPALSPVGGPPVAIFLTQSVVSSFFFVFFFSFLVVVCSLTQRVVCSFGLQAVCLFLFDCVAHVV